MPKVTKAIVPAETVMGRDEMNLAEFPIALLSNREPEDGGPLVFESRYGKLTITGTQGSREKGNGLPTASDTDVLIGLIQLTKRANNFTEPTVYFSRYELLRIIRWPDQTKSYRRLLASLKRWTKVSLDYEKSWFDNHRKCRIDASIHILNEVIVYERVGRGTSGDPGRGEAPTSSFSWGAMFFKSCQQNYLKRLDLDVYFSLESPATKQLYRFLDKHFRHHDALTFELRELAVGHVGLSPGYTIPRIKEKLAPCLEELERVGLIEAATKELRYSKTGHGRWDITFKRAGRADEPVAPGVAEPESPLARELIGRGITPVTARELVRGCEPDVVAEKLEVFDWLIARKDKRVSKNPAGYLAKSILDGFVAPRGFTSKAQREAERRAAEEAERELLARRLDARSREAAERGERSAVEAHLAGLTAEERAGLEREAYAASELDARLFGRMIVRDHVRRLLGL